MAAHHRSAPSARLSGFTLIELLVAMALMSLLALLSWRTLDGMSRTQTITQDHAQRWQNWQTALAQWDTDLNALTDSNTVPPLDYDGRVLRLTRTDIPGTDPRETGLRVVAWSLQPDPAGGPTRWARWLSPPLRTRQTLQQAWQQANQWGRNATAQDRLMQTLLPAVTNWQLFYHRGGAWTNHQSSAASGETPPTPGSSTSTPLPDGIRLTLTLPNTGIPSGTITRDWARPTLSGNLP